MRIAPCFLAEKVKQKHRDCGNDDFAKTRSVFKRPLILREHGDLRAWHDKRFAWECLVGSVSGVVTTEIWRATSLTFWSFIVTRLIKVLSMRGGSAEGSLDCKRLLTLLTNFPPSAVYWPGQSQDIAQKHLKKKKKLKRTLFITTKHNKLQKTLKQQLKGENEI